MDAVPQWREVEDEKTPAQPMRYFPRCLPCLGADNRHLRRQEHEGDADLSRLPRCGSFHPLRVEALMSKRVCRAILLPMGAPACVVEIEADLSGLQAAVGGLIENVARIALGRGTGRTADLWHNEKSRLLELPENRTVILPYYMGDIAGPILISAADETDGTTYSLTEVEIALLLPFVELWPLGEVPPEGGPQ